jgi:hypothetical protein
MGPQKEIAVRTPPAAFLDTVLTSDTLVARLHTMTIFVAAATEGEIVGTIACRRATNRTVKAARNRF